MAKRPASSPPTARSMTPPTLNSMAALLSSPPARRSLLPTIPTPRSRTTTPSPTPQTTTPTPRQQLEVVRLPHPLSNSWPSGVMMTASQNLAVQLQFTQNLRRCPPNVLLQPALHPPTPLARLPRRCLLPRPLGCQLVKPRPVGPKLIRLKRERP